jgi:hypothetical protein
MPGPPQYGGQPVTNIRNVSSPYWREWLGKDRSLRGTPQSPPGVTPPQWDMK